MTPILNGNLSIHAIRCEAEKGPISFKIVFTHPVQNGPESPPLGWQVRVFESDYIQSARCMAIKSRYSEYIAGIVI